MLEAMPAVHEEVPDLNMCRLTAGGRIGVVLDDHPLRPGLTEPVHGCLCRPAVNLTGLE